MSTFLFIAFILTGVFGAILAKKLTVLASITGGILGVLIFLGVGWSGIALLGCFFLLGTLTTSWQKGYKQKRGIVKEGESQRTTGQVLANGGVAGLLGLSAYIFPEQEKLMLVLMAAAFSSATSDTVSSELGTVYGKNFYDILSFQKGRQGENGVVSLEGTLFGILGSSFIAGIYTFGAGWDQCFFLIIAAGTIGNLSDSVLGATLERNGVFGNNAVNFFNTLIAAVAAYLFLQI